MWKKDETHTSVSPNAAPDGATSNGETDRGGSRLRGLSTGRRGYLRLAGAGLATLGGLGFGAGSIAEVAEAAPPNSTDWQLTFEDDFSDGSLDTNKWGVGFGWGRRANYSDGYAADENVSVRNGQLVLNITEQTRENKSYSAGVVHTKDEFEFGPGTYLECRVRMNDVPGCNQAFWSKTSRDPPEWPPEIDFFECPMHSADSITRTTHHVHWTRSGEVADSSTHESFSAGDYNAGQDLSESFVTIGCLWTDDRIVYYADGQQIGGTSRDDILGSVNNGAPHYMMLSQAVDLSWIDSNTPSDLSGYKTTNEIDWVRVYDYAPDSGGGGGGGTGDEHYLWARSADGSPFEFAFKTSGGNVRLGSGGSAPEYWVADDGTAGGGMTDKTGSLPGFRYDGEITSLLYRGSLELFVDDQPVDRSNGTNASNVISIGDPDTQASYELDVTGDLAKSRANGASINAGDAISGSTASGGVSGGVDSYLFSGDIATFSYSGSPRVLLNGEEVDPDSLAAYEHTITFDGRDGQGEYELTVAGDIVKSDANGASINPNDTISGSTASGQVNGGQDSYEFDGDVQAISADPSITVLVDGSEYEPGERVEVSQASDSGAVDYIIESNGTFETLDGGDESAGSKAHGTVIGGIDSYRLTGGEITDVSTFGGDVTVTVDGTEWSR